MVRGSSESYLQDALELKYDARASRVLIGERLMKSHMFVVRKSHMFVVLQNHLLVVHQSHIFEMLEMKYDALIQKESYVRGS